MTTAPADTRLSPSRGRLRFALLGYALRAVKALPAPVRERLLDSTKGGVSSNLPPFPDVLRLVSAAGGFPDGTRWQERLVAERPALRGVRVRDITDDTAGRVRARLYLPPMNAAAPSEALVWVHGGAFVLGSLDQIEAHWPAVELAASGIPVLSVDYRKAINGVHYPTPQDDVLSAWHWAVSHADELGVTPDQLHLGGGSAGACMIAGAALRLRDTGQAQPASLYLAYPVLQRDLPSPTPQMGARLAGLDLTPDAWIHDMFDNWAGDTSPDHPYVAPGLAELTGLPPTYVLSCEHDTLRRASEPFVERLRATGIPVWHDILPGAEHATFDRPGTPDGEQSLKRLRTWLTGGLSAMAPAP